MAILDPLRYRPEIDGLRGIAVLAVVLFHTGFACPGGFVGVDVFFVISGFLITSLIWKDLEAQRFTLGNFWERRVRRIVPALVVVTIATVIAGWFLLLPADYESLGKAAASQSLFAANFYYWRHTGYFSGAADEKPLLHTWSLAVEEQFYLIVPLLLWGMYRFRPLKRRNALIPFVSLGVVLSFVLSIYGVSRHPSAAFYLLPMRAWELGLGSLIAFLPPSIAILSPRPYLREWLSRSGLLLILIPVFVYEATTPFPGLAALPPCLGAALIIWSNTRAESRIPTIPGRLLAVPPLTFIGAVSYSWYLWHWPLLAFGTYLATSPMALPSRFGLFMAGFACALASWHFVEKPFRRRRIGRSRNSMFSYAGAGLAAALGLGWLCITTHGFQRRFPSQVETITEASVDKAFINELVTDDIRRGNAIRIGAKAQDESPVLLVWGDSHAMAALPAVDALLAEMNLAGRAITHSATAPVFGWFRMTPYGLNEDSIAFNEEVFSYIRENSIPLVLLHASWKYYAEAPRAKGGRIGTALSDTIRRLVAIGAKPWVMLDVPIHSFDVPRMLSRSLISGQDISYLCTLPNSEDPFDGIKPGVMAEIRKLGGRIIDPKPAFLEPGKPHYQVESGGVVLYRDHRHLTVKGAKLILKPFLTEALSDELSRYQRGPGTVESGVGSGN